MPRPYQKAETFLKRFIVSIQGLVYKKRQITYLKVLVPTSLTKFLESVGPTPRIYEAELSQFQIEASPRARGLTDPIWIAEIYIKVALSSG